MASVPPVIPPVTTTPAPSKPATIADIEAALAKFAANAKAEESKAYAWLKANWAHFVTWLLTGISALKLFGKL